jgi:hypothetical protein
MDPCYPNKPPPNEKYDKNYGFEVRREKPWANLPCFIPFNKILQKSTMKETD